MSWRLTVTGTGTVDKPPGLLDVIAIQDAWRLLSPQQRAAVTAAYAHDGHRLDNLTHPATAKALQRHGLAANGALTEAGALLARLRPLGRQS